MINLFNQITGTLLLISFPLKAVMQYLHVKSYHGKERKLVDYLFALPVIDKYNSIYKHLANFLVFYQYLMIGIFFYQYRTFFKELWERWDNMP